MTWMDEEPGTVTQWAAELTYGDGEKRHYSDWFDEAEAKEYAEVHTLELLRQEDAPSGETTVVAYRAISRQVTYSEWK